MIDISAQFGWTLEELYSRMGARELSMRVVRRMNELGYTYDQSKITAMEEEKKRRAIEKFEHEAKAAFKEMGK